MVIKPFIFEKGEKTLSLEWAKNENFLHFLLKFGVVYQLLSHGFDISNIKIEKRIGSARADILASRRGINYWIECETAIDDEFSKMKDLKKYSKGFKGRKIVVSPFSNFYPAPVKNMIKNSEWWLMQFKYPSIICFGIRKDKEGNRWLLLDEFSQSYVKRITGLRFKRGYIDYLWLEQN
jgi:hypothetical protein